MNDRGFTVLEVVVGLALTIVLIGLVISTVMTTNRVMTRMEIITDETTAAEAYFRLTGQLLQNIRTDRPFEFDHRNLRFVSLFQGVEVEVFSGNGTSGDSAVLLLNGTQRARFPGHPEFTFLHGDTEWRSDWNETVLPVSVVCTLISQMNDINPFEMVITLPSTRQSDVQQIPEEHESIDTDDTGSLETNEPGSVETEAVKLKDSDENRIALPAGIKNGVLPGNPGSGELEG